jgi:hypothetical protein
MSALKKLLFKLKKNNKKEKSSYNIVKELLPTKRK